VTAQIEVLESKEAVARRAADLLVSARGHVALSGGSTPKAAYVLAGQERTDWTGVTLWLGDERYVPIDDERSNAGMVRASLGLVPELVRTDLPLEEAAADYGRRFKAAGGRLELSLMGLGPDGHTASLFPGKPALEEDHHLVVEVPEPGLDPRVPRVTLTFPAFAAAREVVFLVAGEDKAEAMVRAFGDEPDLSAPAARVRAGERLLVLADRAAAAHLR
jgi:6-phosphogluconolactonase